MTEIEKKSNRRRRRRPRQRGREEQNVARSADVAAPAPVVESAPARPPANENRQRRVRRAHTPAPGGPERRQEVRVHEQTMGGNMGISPLDPNIVIYTYTLRPRGMAEGYGSGPGLADKMMYEQRDASD